VFRAQLFSTIAWYKNNRLFFISMFIWPYLMVGIIFALGSIYGNIQQFSARLNVSNPAIYLLASSVVAMSSLYIIDAVAGFALYNRWIGTLPYIILSPIRTPVLMMIAGLPESLVSPIVTIIAILPAAIYFEGFMGAIKTLIVLFVIFLGMIPMIGFSSLIASIILLVKEESNILSSLSPFMLLVSGVFYPIEILPRILQIISKAIPITYVVDASKLVATYFIPNISMLLIILYLIGVLAVLYNLIAFMAIGRAEKAVKKAGVF